MDRGHALLTAQVVCLAGLAWPGPPRWPLPAPLWLAGAGLLTLGAAAGGAAGLAQGAQLRAHPAPGERSELRTDGVYAWSRHPMYVGVLAGAAGVALLRRRPEPIAFLGLLSAVFHVKAGYEEQLLARRYGAAYTAYAGRTPRLLPGRRPSR